jgi:uracil-DNA glycosylase
VPVTDWNPRLRDQFDEPYWIELQRFVAEERAAGLVHPPHDDVFAALHLTPLSEVRAVILGQDPYHGPGQAHGLAFSVRPGVTIQPSLRNIFAERQSDLGLPPPEHGCLDRWARDGVLLLNTTLTVRNGSAGSHQGRGWETFTDQVIRVVSSGPEPVVFILWGASARKKAALVDRSRHTVVQSAHPSPLSASGGFFGSKPFSAANDSLVAAGRAPLSWRVDGED